LAEAEATCRALIAVAAAAAASAVAFGVVKAAATPGAGIVGGPIVARGPLPQDVAIGVPKTITVTRTVRVRVGTRTVSKRVSFRVATIERLATCTTRSPAVAGHYGYELRSPPLPRRPLPLP
jgi:hypothetical protein